MAIPQQYPPGSLDSKAWKMPEREERIIVPQVAPEEAPRILRPGDPYKVELHFYGYEDREFSETCFMLFYNIDPNDETFQDMFMRYWWDEDDGSPHDGNYYEYGDGYTANREFESLRPISRPLMQQLMDENVVHRPHVYNRMHLEGWLEREDEYNNYHGYNNDD